MTDSEIDIEENFNQLALPNIKRLPFSVSSHLYEKLTKHLFLLKALKKKCSQSEWICSAINENLESENVDGDIPKQRKINLSIDEMTFQKLEERVQVYKQIYSSFSKKQWVIEAIYKKLDRDYKQLKEELQKLHANQLKK